MAVNSSTTCQDPTEAFRSIETLFFCFRTLGELETNGQSYTAYANTSFGGLIEDCIDQYCQKPDQSLKGCSNSYYPGDSSVTFYTLTANPSWAFQTAKCGSVSVETNDDVAGPGIMVAYLMQLLIIFSIWLILRLIQFIPFSARYLSGKRNQSATQDSRKAKLYRHAPIVKSILVDFQESQCYFVLSVQAAMMVALTGNAAVLGATNLKQLWQNFQTIVSMSAGYITSLTFGLWLLHRSHLDSPYMLAWSLAAIIFSAFTLFSKIPQEPNIAGINEIAGVDDLDKCGHNPPPLIYCSQYFTEIYTIERCYIAACLFICSVLLFQNTVKYLGRHLNGYPVYSRLCQVMQPVLGHKAIRILQNVWPPLAEMFLLGINLMYITANFYQPGGDWTFGQIIAVTIWVPIITKYIYWAMFGTPAYSAIRFCEPLHIVQMDPKQDPSAEFEENRTHEPLSSDSAMDLRPIPARTLTWS